MGKKNGILNKLDTENPQRGKNHLVGGEVHNCVTNFLACLGEYLLDGEISLTGLRERECLTLTKV